MATSSSDESSTAPKDFHLSSSLDSGSRLSPNRQRCPLCASFRETFFCAECVRNGDFYTRIPYESYSNKEVKWLDGKSRKKQLEDGCLPLLEKKLKADLYQSKINQYKDRNRILKLAIEEKTKRQNANREKLQQLHTKNLMLLKSLPKYGEQVDKRGIYVAKKREDIARYQEKLAEKQERLKRITRIRIQQLVEYIFPIDKIQPKCVDTDSSTESPMVSAISEAVHTTYLRDRWVYTDNSGELQYSIVAPTLPGSGNYSAYTIWGMSLDYPVAIITVLFVVAQNKEGVPGASMNTSAVEHNPAYSISAALTYTAQLVNVIAYYLDVRLPYKMLYSDFCSNDMDSRQFARRVSRLNANVLHLCFAQNVDLASLTPLQTLQNILQLIDPLTVDLGRHGPFEVDAHVTASLEEQLGQNLHTGEDSDSEGGDAFPYEWEAPYPTVQTSYPPQVPHVQLPEASAGPMNLQSTQTISSQQQANSIAGGLYTSAAASIASLWRGWTGR